MRVWAVALPLLALVADAAAQDRLRLRELSRTRIPFGQTTSLAFGPDVIACGGQRGDIALFELPTRGRVASLDFCDGAVSGIAFHPSGDRFAAIGGNSVGVWSWPACEPLLENPLPTTWSGNSLGVAWHPTETLLAYFVEDRAANVLDTSKREIVATRSFPGRELIGVAFSRDGTRVVVGRARGPFTQWVWRSISVNRDGSRALATPLPMFAADGRQLLRYRGGGLELGSDRVELTADLFACSNNGEWFVVSNQNVGIAAFDLRLTTTLITDRVFKSRDRDIVGASLAISDDGEYVARAGTGYPAILWHRGQIVGELRGNVARAETVEFDGTGTRVVALARQQAYTIDVATGRPTLLGDAQSIARDRSPASMLLVHNGIVYSRALDEDGDEAKRVLFDAPEVASVSPSPTLPGTFALRTGGDPLGATHVSLRTSRDLFDFDHRYVSRIGWSRDGATVVFATMGMQLWGGAVPSMWVHDARTGLERWRHDESEDLQCVALSPSGDRVVWGGLGQCAIAAVPKTGEDLVVVRREGGAQWIAFLDRDHMLMHAGDELLLVRASDLERLQTIGVIDTGHRLTAVDLAAARNRIVFATRRDVVVYALERER